MTNVRTTTRNPGPNAAPGSSREREAAELDRLLDRAVAGAPRWRRTSTRRELAAYIEDAFAEMRADGVPADQALRTLRVRFGSPDLVAAGFRALPPPRWARSVRVSAGPLGAAVLGLVLGLALLQLRTPTSNGRSELVAVDAGGLFPTQGNLARRHVREVASLRVPAADTAAGAVGYQVASRLGVVSLGPRVLEPSVPALTPTWLPSGYALDGALFLTGSATVQYFADERTGGAGIVVEVLRPDRSTVFQIKERHVFPVQVGTLPGFYIDGEWEVRGPRDEQPAPATWRTDRSHSLLFARDGLLVLVAGPADVLDADGLMRIARSLRPPPVEP